MANTLLLVIFIIKILAQPGLFKYIKEKYGHNVMQQCRSYERLCTRKQKLVSDLEFLVKCKREGLIPVFARPKLSIDVPHKTREKISKLILESEINNKHKIKNELNKKLTNEFMNIKSILSFAASQAIRYRIRKRVMAKKEKWSGIHEQKPTSLRSQVPAQNRNTVQKFSVNFIHKFSTYVLSKREKEVLSYTLDH